jgi:hypothetical protein
MANLSYKNQLIVVSAQVDKITKSWISIVEIFCLPDVQRRIHAIESPLQNFGSWREAEGYLIDLAKAWIDDYLENRVC